MVLFGEIFFDVYEDRSFTPGGSALNIAWNLHGLGLVNNFVGRVGKDIYGERAFPLLKNWGIDTSLVQIDPAQPTGIIKVVLDENKKPTFISPDTIAIDFIEYVPEFNKFSNDEVFYHGTYILRNDVTRNTVARLKKKGLAVFMDLNLRDPYWSHELLDEWARDLYMLKLSDDESAHLLRKNLSGEKQIEALQKFLKERNIENALFTLGDKGSYWLKKDQTFFTETPKVKAIDTTGAGDAYCSGVLFSKHLGLSPEESIRKASEFSARICTIHGATSPEKSFYLKCRKEIWG